MLRRVGTAAALLLVSAGLGHAAHAQGQTTEFDDSRFVRQMTGVETCLACHGSYNPVVRRPGEPRHSLWINSDLFYQSVHARVGCQGCHRNIDEHGHREVGRQGTLPDCLPCHSVERDMTDEQRLEHQQEMALDAGLDPIMTEALRACIDCHREEFDIYATSAHGQAVAEHKVEGAPFCIDCHGIHYILPADHELSLTNPANIPSTCLNCHGQSDIKLRAGLTREIGESFEGSFHGKRGKLGDISVAVCNTCHGSHDLYPADDARSRINRSQIAKTCGECHEGAQLNFATAFTHRTVSPNEQLGLYILQQAYQWLIFLLIAQFIVFAALDIFQHFRRRLRRRKTGSAGFAPPDGSGTGSEELLTRRPRVFERFNLHHRIQHFLMAFPFTMLVITGWPMRFPDLKVSQVSSAIVGGVHVVGILHRIFGITLVVVSVYHIAYLVIMYLRGHRSGAMLPSWQDAKEAFGDVLYWLGLRKERMAFGRYNWIEKIEYYAVVWGTAVMILSGLIIWVPTVAARFLPSWALPASVIVHGYEALLAGLAIFLWHFYWVHLHPQVYPMSTVWLTGKLTEEEMRHHHPRELDELTAQSDQGPEEVRR